MSGHPVQLTTASPSPERCVHCVVTTETLKWETAVAGILCEAARDQPFFEDHTFGCLAMTLFVERKLQPPVNARQLLLRMKELRTPLP